MELSQKRNKGISTPVTQPIGFDQFRCWLKILSKIQYERDPTNT